MPRSRNHRFLNVGGHMSHDDGLQRTEGLLPTHGQDWHQQLRLLENLVILCILRECSELRKASPHSSRLRIGRSEEVSSRLVGFAWIAREVIPNSVKIDALPAGNQLFRVRSMKIEMPDAGV